MKINSIKSGNIISVYLSGRLDIHISMNIEAEINKMIDFESSLHFIFNLQDVEYVSSSALTLFLSAKCRLNQKGKKFVLCCLNSSVRKIIELVEMTAAFEIFKTEYDAFEYLKSLKIVKRNIQETLNTDIIVAAGL